MRILVTGASGFLGSRIVEKLIESKFEVRALVRETSNKELLEKQHVELFVGDLRDRDSLAGIYEDIDAVIHAGATTSGSLEDFENGTINGTRNMLELAKSSNLKKFIHISSLVVYDINSIPKNSLINESFELERNPRQVGPYGYSKTESEKISKEYADEYNLPLTIVRPGIIYGANRNLFFPHLGFRLLGGKIIVKIGLEKKILPLTYIDNTCDAILEILEQQKTNGKIYNIVDPQTITYSQYLKYYLKAHHLRSIVVPLPFSLLKLFAFFCEKLRFLPVVGKKLTMSRYRLNPKFKKVRFDGSLILKDINWYPEISLEEGLERAFTESN